LPVTTPQYFPTASLSTARIDHSLVLFLSSLGPVENPLLQSVFCLSLLLFPFGRVPTVTPRNYRALRRNLLVENSPLHQLCFSSSPPHRPGTRRSPPPQSCPFSCPCEASNPALFVQHLLVLRWRRCANHQFKFFPLPHYIAFLKRFGGARSRHTSWSILAPVPAVSISKIHYCFFFNDTVHPNTLSGLRAAETVWCPAYGRQLRYYACFPLSVV